MPRQASSHHPVKQIAITRSASSADLSTAIGTPLLGRQVGGAVALVIAEAVYAIRPDGREDTAVASGDGVGAVAGPAASSPSRRWQAYADTVASGLHT